jgi:hypothetical protein
MSRESIVKWATNWVPAVLQTRFAAALAKELEGLEKSPSYVIEMQGGPPRMHILRWNGRDGEFTVEPDKAIRFARQEDADRVRAWLSEDSPLPLRVVPSPNEKESA